MKQLIFCRTFMLAPLYFAINLLLLGSCQQETGYTLVSSKTAANIWLAPGEPDFVQLTVEDLISDVKKITGKELQIVENQENCQNCVIIGSLDNPEAKEGLSSWLEEKEVSQMEGQWESYSVKNYENQLVIAGSNPRGTMFALYHFIEKYLEVDPLYFWTGLEPEPKETLSWETVEISQSSPTFRFRGWFINDEDLLTEWKNGGGNRKIDYRYYSQVVHPEVIRPVLEAALRLRFNLIIPASFADIRNPPEARLVEEAAKRGLYVSMHHVEPMGVSAFGYQNYWEEKGEKPLFSFYSEPEKLKEVWRAYAEKWAEFPNVIWQIGLRGIADRPMWMADPGVPQSDAERGKIISDAMQAQYEIIKEVTQEENPLITTTLWAEGAGLNQAGHLTFPEGTIVVFADNSPGWKWQGDFYETQREENRKYGVYYHHQLWGSGPHLVQAVPPAKTHEMFKLAIENDASDYAIMNVSNVREFAPGLAASSDMLYDFEAFNADAFLQNWCEEKFGQAGEEAARAYQKFFDSFQLHPITNSPMLLDGQTRSFGLSALRDIRLQLTDPEKYAAQQEARQKMTEEKTWGTRYLSDMHPGTEMTADTLLRHVLQQTDQLGRVESYMKNVLPLLSGDTLTFFENNLLAQQKIMYGLSLWLEFILKAQLALEEGNQQAAASHVSQALQQFDLMKEGKALASRGDKWQHWYRGDRKMNLNEAEKLTQEVLELLR